MDSAQIVWDQSREVAATRPQRIVLGFPAMLVCAIVFLVCATVRSRYDDPDLWWHLKTGELILKSHAIPTADPFSFSAPHAPWVAQEWLSQLSMAVAYRVAGAQGLLFWLCAMASGLLTAGFLLCWRVSRDPRVAALGTIAVWFFSMVGLAIRPHMIGYLLLVLELLVLELGRTRSARWFFALPPLFGVWINCHSSFILGLIVLVIFGVTGCFAFTWGLLRFERLSKKAGRALAMAAVLSAACLFLNPVGPKLIWYPLDVIFNQPLNISSIAEWQPTGPSTVRGIAMLLFGAALLLIPMLRRRHVHGGELLLALFGFWMAASHIRMLFVFGILAAPLFCRTLRGVLPALSPVVRSQLVNAALICLGLVYVVRNFPSAADLERQAQSANPVEALAYVRNAGLTGPMLNDYDFGGFLVWAAPERKVFIDGRADVFEPAGVLADYKKLLTLEQPSQVLDKYRIAYCLLERESRIARVLALLPNWETAYSDAKAVVFVRSAKGADTRHQSGKDLASALGGAPDTATVLRELLRSAKGADTRH